MMRIDFNRMTPEQLSAYMQGGIPAVEALNTGGMGAGSGALAPPASGPVETVADTGVRDYAAPPRDYAVDYAAPPRDYAVDYAAPPLGTAPASPSLGADLGYGVGSYTDPGSGYSVYPNAVPTGVGPGGPAETVADTGVRDFQFPPAGPVETVADTGVRDFGYPPPDANAIRDQIAELLAQQPRMPDMISGSV